MNVVKVKFQVMSLEENIDTVKWTFYEDGDDLSVHNYTINYFPELKGLSVNDDKEKVYKMIEEVVTKDYEFYKDRIASEASRYNDIWSAYNDKYFSMLSEYLGVGFPEDVKEIVAKVGLIPTFPRHLDSFSFSIATGCDEEKLIETTAHETLHFMWFVKWKKLHPETPRRHYDSPYIEWKYSEMVTDPILNNYPFNKLFNIQERGYDSFYELYDNEELVMDKLRDMYATDDNIDKKIDDGFNYVKNILKK